MALEVHAQISEPSPIIFILSASLAVAASMFKRVQLVCSLQVSLLLSKKLILQKYSFQCWYNIVYHCVHGTLCVWKIDFSGSCALNGIMTDVPKYSIIVHEILVGKPYFHAM